MAVQTVGLCGSGIMATGILQVAATSGFDVVLRSRTEAKAEATRGRVCRALDRLVEKGRMIPDEATEAFARMQITSDIDALQECDLVIETIVESMAAKQELFRDLDGTCKPDTIFATNTSTLPVVEMAVSTGRPERLVGIHFFNPAAVMRLVEVVRPLTASDDTMATVLDFVSRCDKDAVVVKDQAGFVVNALLFPYLNNAVKLLENSVADRDAIDAAMKGGCGFPMGPLALLDLVGLDTSVAILDALYEEYRDPNFAPAPRLKRMVAAGLLGRKAGRGFYEY